MLNSAASAPDQSRHSRLRMPLLGAARISQAMAPRKGGVTKDAVIKVRIMRRARMSVRAASQASGMATATLASDTEMAMVRVVRMGSASVGSVTSAAKLASVNAPAGLVKAYQASHASGRIT